MGDSSFCRAQLQRGGQLRPSFPRVGAPKCKGGTDDGTTQVSDRRRRRCSPARRGKSHRQGPRPRGWRNRRGLAPDLSAALQKFRATIPGHFDREYVNNAVVPFFLGSIFAGERPILPMIDRPLTKQDAIPWDFWGMLYEDWKPTPSDGVTVFLEGLENRGDNNLRKRIYFAGVTPDLYAPKYQAKVVDFFDKLLDPKFTDRP